MFKNVASQKVAMFAFDITTGAPKTGDGANITPYVSKDYGTVTALSTATATEMSSTNAPGWYSFTLTQAETNADALLFSAKSSTSNVSIVGVQIFTDPPNYTAFSVDSSGRVDLIKIAGTTQTARDIGASVLLSSGTGTGQVKLSSGYVAPNWGDVGNPTTTVNLSGTTISTSQAIASVSGAVGSVTGAVGSVTGAVGSVTGNVGGNVNGNVVGSVASVTNRVTANTDQLAGQTVTAAAGVTFPSSVASPTNITAGTITTVTNLTNAPTNGDFTATMKTSLADTVWDAPIADHLDSGSTGAALNAAGSAGDPWSTPIPAAYGAGTAGKIVGDALDATVSSRLAPTTSGRTLDVTATGAAGIDWGNVENQSTSVNLSGTTTNAVNTATTTTTVTGLNPALIDVATSTRLAAASYTAPDNSGITAIKDQTDQLAFTVPNQVDSNIRAVNDINVTGTGTGGDPWGP